MWFIGKAGATRTIQEKKRVWERRTCRVSNFKRRCSQAGREKEEKGVKEAVVVDN